MQTYDTGWRVLLTTPSAKELTTKHRDIKLTIKQIQFVRKLIKLWQINDRMSLLPCKCHFCFLPLGILITCTVQSCGLNPYTSQSCALYCVHQVVNPYTSQSYIPCTVGVEHLHIVQSCYDVDPVLNTCICLVRFWTSALFISRVDQVLKTHTLHRYISRRSGL